MRSAAITLAQMPRWHKYTKEMIAERNAVDAVCEAYGHKGRLTTWDQIQPLRKAMETLRRGVQARYPGSELHEWAASRTRQEQIRTLEEVGL